MTEKLSTQLVCAMRLDELQPLVENMQCHVPFWGGRRWTVAGYDGSVSLNEMIAAVRDVVEIAPRDEWDLGLLDEVVSGLRRKDAEGQQIVNGRPWLTRVFTWVRQWMSRAFGRKGTLDRVAQAWDMAKGGVEPETTVQVGASTPPSLTHLTLDRPQRPNVRPPSKAGEVVAEPLKGEGCFFYLDSSDDSETETETTTETGTPVESGSEEIEESEARTDSEGSGEWEPMPPLPLGEESEKSQECEASDEPPVVIQLPDTSDSQEVGKMPAPPPSPEPSSQKAATGTVQSFMSQFRSF